MNRRQVLQTLAALSVVPAALAAAPKSDGLIFLSRKIPLTEARDLYGSERELRMTDLREIEHWCPKDDTDLHVRWDVKWRRNARGKICQYGIDACVRTPQDLMHMRKTALEILQKKFSQHKRIRANLIPLEYPPGMAPFPSNAYWYPLETA